MAGPVASVLVRDVLAFDQLTGILQSLGIFAVCENLRSVPRDWTLAVRLTEFAGESIVEAWLHPVGAECLGERSLEDFVQLESALGWAPRFEVVLGACCNAPVDHHALAWLLIEIAEPLQGMIDCNGRLALPDALRADSAVLQIPYEIADGRQGTFDIVSPAFLRAWRKHPQFRMVK